MSVFIGMTIGTFLFEAGQTNPDWNAAASRSFMLGAGIFVYWYTSVRSKA